MIEISVSGRCPRSLSSQLIQHVVDETVSAIPSRDRRNLGHRLGIRFVTSAEMKKRNRTYRGFAHATDVLSFEPIHLKGISAEEKELGDLMIAPAVATAQARKRSIDPQEELVRLIVHGVLHLCGYDHAQPTDEARMFAMQERVVEMSLCNS